MQKRTFLVVSWSSWAFFAASLIGLHYFLARPRTSEDFTKLRAIYGGLDETTKKSLQHFESGIIKLEDGQFHFVGAGFESEQQTLAAANKVSLRKIEFVVADPLELERRLMAGEAFKKLNNAEKKCFADRFAAIVFRDGSYFFYFNPDKYAEYVAKYGTECKSCEEEKKANQIRNKGVS